MFGSTIKPSLWMNNMVGIFLLSVRITVLFTNALPVFNSFPSEPNMLMKQHSQNEFHLKVMRMVSVPKLTYIDTNLFLLKSGHCINIDYPPKPSFIPAQTPFNQLSSSSSCGVTIPSDCSDMVFVH